MLVNNIVGNGFKPFPTSQDYMGNKKFLLDFGVLRVCYVRGCNMIEGVAHKIWKNSGKSRKPNRLPKYDYSQNGHYFVTMCAHGRVEWFGEINNGEMKSNEFGEIIQKCWNDLVNHYKNIKLDEFIVMPNHVHGIIIIDNGTVGNGLKPFPTITVRQFMNCLRKELVKF